MSRSVLPLRDPEFRVLNGRGAGETLDFQFGPDDSVTGFLLGGFFYEKTG